MADEDSLSKAQAAAASRIVAGIAVPEPAAMSEELQIGEEGGELPESDEIPAREDVERVSREFTRMTKPSVFSACGATGRL
jgi:hypothetical protein